MGLNDANGKLAPHVYLMTMFLDTTISAAAVYSGKALKKLLGSTPRSPLMDEEQIPPALATTTASPVAGSALGSHNSDTARVALVSVDVMSFLVAATMATELKTPQWNVARVDAIIQHMCALEFCMVAQSMSPRLRYGLLSPRAPQADTAPTVHRKRPFDYSVF